jgi:hypothetical protein
MKFETQERSQPTNGENRNLLKFAWLPVKVEQPYTGKKFILWLDKYHEQQIFTAGGNYGDNWAKWKTVSRWIG